MKTPATYPTLGVCQCHQCATIDEVHDVLNSIPEPDGPTLWALPELFFGGFDYARKEEVVKQSAEVRALLVEHARNLGIALAGSLWRTGDTEDGYLNTLFLYAEDGTESVLCDKAHLFPGIPPGPSEEDHFLPGTAPLEPVAWQGLHLGGAICYDLRFPEMFRHQAQQTADVFIVTAQWPERRISHWEALLAARAIENQAIVLGANMCGVSAGIELGGRSCLLSPWGNPVFKTGTAEEFISASAPGDDLANFRKNFNTRRSARFPVSETSTPHTSLAIS